MAPNANEIARQARIAKGKLEQARMEADIPSPILDLIERAESAIQAVIVDAERLSETLRDLA